MLKPFTRYCAAAVFVSAFATGASGANLVKIPEAASAAAVAMSPPLINWAAPQFFNAPHGAFSSDGSFGAKPQTKGQSGNGQTLATFIPIQPCRLVDTRGFGVPGPVYWMYSERDSVGTTGHNPTDPASPPPAPQTNPFSGQQANSSGGSYAVFPYSGVPPGSLSPALLGEYRVYKATGHCGIPAGSNRVVAISVAVTTLPTAASGDVEVLATGQPMAHDVLMVQQAQQWNSAASSTALDPNGNFTVQVRSPNAQTPISADLAVDVNGYYVVMDPSNTSDYFSIQGNYTLDGGLLSVTQTGFNNTLGSAISAVGLGSEVHLGGSTNAIDIVTGGIRVRQTGSSPSTAPAYVFNTTGRRCSDLAAGSPSLARLDNTLATGPNLANLMVFAQARNAAPAVSVTYTSCSGGAADGWYLSYGPGFAGGEQYNILIVSP
ncbi:MAG TPA: hypothetical protein VFA81_00440 [Burkholderiales bacterium]|nr:hypothetical protein [Burkholderiales bacterium]